VLDRVRKFLESQLRPEEAGDPENELRLATAALLVEISRADTHVDAEERRLIRSALRRLFDLSEQASDELLRQAEREVEQAASLYQFTRTVDAEFSPARKKEIVELLWRVGLADGELDKYEEHLVRRIADLLHVSHADFTHARHKALMKGG
jgi:uncharacterized tellurite resistance protein B-like protein